VLGAGGHAAVLTTIPNVTSVGCRLRLILRRTSPMKIDFLGRFEQLQRDFSKPTARSRQEPSVSPFQKIVERSLVVQEHEPAAVQIAPASNSQHEVYARMSFGMLNQELIQEDPKQAIPVTPDSGVKNPVDPVIQPTIVSVKRLTNAELLDREPRSERISVIRGMISSARKTHAPTVKEELGLAVVSAESSFKAGSVSTDGHATKGLFQLLDKTGKQLLKQHDPDGAYQPMNPSQNVALGMKYLSYLQNIFSKETALTKKLSTVPTQDPDSREKLALAAFNAGEGRVALAQRAARRAGKDPGAYEDIAQFLPQSTQDYVRRVITTKDVYS
jgi:hypothetical protein